MRLGERSYYRLVIDFMAERGFLLYREDDGYTETSEGQKVSQPRGTDLYGIVTNGSGRFVSCEVKVGQMPLISDFRTSQVDRLNQTEKYGGVAFAVYVWNTDSAKFIRVFGWNNGSFTKALMAGEL